MKANRGTNHPSRLRACRRSRTAVKAGRSEDLTRRTEPRRVPKSKLPGRSIPPAKGYPVLVSGLPDYRTEQHEVERTVVGKRDRKTGEYEEKTITEVITRPTRTEPGSPIALWMSVKNTLHRTREDARRGRRPVRLTGQFARRKIKALYD